ncbi:MAG: hypothetical protein R3313_03385 [Candidatus Saccharimonadales bacterium]|nr:hypothetical protein [Candidatus Saccharimonadales bacterium]
MDPNNQDAGKPPSQTDSPVSSSPASNPEDKITEQLPTSTSESVTSADDAPPAPIPAEPGKEATTVTAPTPAELAGLDAAKKSPVKWIMLFLAVLLIGGGGFLGYRMYQMRDLGPEDTFNAMLENSLKTSTFTQQYSLAAEGNEVKLTADSDFSDIANVKNDVETVVKSTVFTTIEVDASIRAIDEDVFIKYNSVDVEGADSPDQQFPEDALNKWVQTVDDGTALSSSDSFGLESFSEGLGTVANAVMIGNFSDQQRNDILKYIEDNPVYEYDLMGVEEEELDGESVYKYQVTAKADGLKGMFELVRGFSGLEDIISEEDISSRNDTEFSAWVSKGTRRLLKVMIEQDGAELVVEYSNFNAPLDISPPTDSLLPIEEFENILSNGSSEQSNNSPSDAAKDAEIRTDINSLTVQLEIFYADNGYYPQSADGINVTNMPGLDPDALVTPDGVMLGSEGGYQYTSADCGVSQCSTFTLTAILSDGTEYSKQSLN